MTNPTDLIGENPAETMRKVMENYFQPRSLDLGFVGDTADEVLAAHRPTLVAVPNGMKVENLTGDMIRAAEFMAPLRRKGTARVDDLESLILWTNRFKDEGSAIFADPDKDRPSMTAIANYHPAQDGAPRHGDHRAVYAFPLSDEWQAWQSISGEPMGKDVLGNFIEDNAKDIQNPTPGILKGDAGADGLESWEIRMIRLAQDIEGRFGTLPELLAMSRSFQVHEKSNLEVRTNRDTGEQSINFLNEHSQPDGSPLKIPNLFMIAIPVFQGGALYRLPVRFRYRKSGATLTFSLKLYAPEKAFRDAVMGACTRAAEETELPVIMGKPEA